MTKYKFWFLIIFILHLYFLRINCEETNSSTTSFERFYRNSSELTTTPYLAEDEDINSKQRKSEIFSQILNGSYDSSVRPRGISGSGPTIVLINVIVRSIDNIDDKAMEYSVQLIFRQEWVDPRLAYSHIQSNIQYLQLTDSKRIWLPDVFFSQEKKGTLHDLMLPNDFTRIFPDGLVSMSHRITLLVTCIFNLKKFPLVTFYLFDVQSCPITMESYGWTSKDLMLRWRDKNAAGLDKDFAMARFLLSRYWVSNDCKTVTTVGNFTCVKLYLSFSREFGFYLIQIYIPCAMLVIVSWVSFWLEPTAIEARVSLGVTTILTIVTQTYGINQSAPPASYVKALDVWTAFCQGMVFGALIQFALVNYISHMQQIKSKMHLTSKISDETEPLPEVIREKEEPYCSSKSSNGLNRAKRIDIGSRILFPCIFVLFNITYCIAYW